MGVPNSEMANLLPERRQLIARLADKKLDAFERFAERELGEENVLVINSSSASVDPEESGALFDKIVRSKAKRVNFHGEGEYRDSCPKQTIAFLAFDLKASVPAFRSERRSIKTYHRRSRSFDWLLMPKAEQTKTKTRHHNEPLTFKRIQRDKKLRGIKPKRAYPRTRKL